MTTQLLEYEGSLETDEIIFASDPPASPRKKRDRSQSGSSMKNQSSVKKSRKIYFDKTLDPDPAGSEEEASIYMDRKEVVQEILEASGEYRSLDISNGGPSRVMRKK